MPPLPPQHDIAVPNLGKITYFVSAERQVLPALTAAIKEYKSIGDADAALQEKFKVMDAFSKKIPPLSVVKEDFAKIDAAMKNQAQMLQSLKLQVNTIGTLVDLIKEEAKEAHKSLLITEQDLKAAHDISKAEALRAQVDAGPLAGIASFVNKANDAAFAWVKAKDNPIAAVAKAFELSESLVKLLGFDTINQQIASLQKQAETLKLQSVIDRFKLAKERLAAMKTLADKIAPTLTDAKIQYLNAKTNFPADFDAYNKRGHFHFTSMTELATMLAAYSALAQKAATAAHAATDNIHTMQGKLGTQWMANVSQDKDVIQKMMVVTSRVMERAVHERDSANAHLKIVHGQIDELEKMLSLTRLKAG